MNTPSPLLSRRSATHAFWRSAWAHTLIWMLVTVAALLLVGFTALVEDITQRGELRAVQQRASDSLLLPEEMQTRSMDVVRLLFMTGEKLAGR